MLGLWFGLPAGHFAGCKDTITIHIQVVEQCRGLVSSGNTARLDLIINTLQKTQVNTASVEESALHLM